MTLSAKYTASDWLFPSFVRVAQREIHRAVGTGATDEWPHPADDVVYKYG